MKPLWNRFPTSNSRRSGLRAALTCLGMLAVGAVLPSCDSPTTPGDPPSMTVEGRLERGSMLAVHLVVNGDTLPGTATLITAQPAAAVEWLATPGELRLKQAGTLRLQATVDGVQIEKALEVAAPPLIVFDLLSPAGRDIHIVALDGEDARALVAHPAEDTRPTAASATVVFTSYRDGNAELYSTPLAGGDAVRLTQTSVAELDPALSPDGSRLAFTRIVGGQPKLFIARSDGTDVERITTTFGENSSIETGPSWGPDGDRLVFVSTHQGSADLWTWSEDEGFAPLVVHPSADVEPAWSPDGRFVAFASTRSGSTALHLVEVETGTVTQLTNRAETDAHPSWLPDGRLVYVSYLGTTPTLRWMDPLQPSISHEIPISGGNPGNPSGVY